MNLEEPIYLVSNASYQEEAVDEQDLPDCLVITAKKKSSGVATKTNPALWARCKSEAKSRMGGKHSARAMQLAVKLYKQRGGGYRGKKPTARTNKMKKWTKQKWMYLSDYKKKKDKNKIDDDLLYLDDSPGGEVVDLDDVLKMFEEFDADDNYAEELFIDDDNAEASPGRYLPEAKWRALSKSEREATDKKKKREGKSKQYVPNTEKAKVKSKAKYY
jgi:hypothetical protein